MVFDPSEISDNFRKWLQTDGLLEALHPYSHAYVALPTNFSVVEWLNQQVRSCSAEWLPNQLSWPDDDWIVGEDGAGNYYTVSKSGDYCGVRFYDHELLSSE